MKLDEFFPDLNKNKDNSDVLEISHQHDLKSDTDSQHSSQSFSKVEDKKGKKINFIGIVCISYNIIKFTYIIQF